jgi:hypothetical protein
MKNYYRDCKINIKIRIKNYIRKKESNIKSAITRGAKPFLVYKKDGTFIGEWLMKSQCAKDLNLKNSGSIIRCLNNKYPFYKDYVFIYEHEKNIIVKKLKEINKKIQVLDKKGNFIGIWKSRKKCAKDLNLNYKLLVSCLLGHRPYHKNFQFNWIY